MRAIALFFVVLLCQCQSVKAPVAVLNGNYYGSWAGTNWWWGFSGDRFMLRSSGGIGPKEARGNFTQRNDSVFIQFLQEDIRPLANGMNRTDTLILFKEDCLLSLRDRYDYCIQNPNKPGEIHISKKYD